VLAGCREFVAIEVLLDRVVRVEQYLLNGLMGEKALERVLGREAGVDGLAEQPFSKGGIVQCAGKLPIDESRIAADVVAAQVWAIAVGLDLYPLLQQRRRAADLQKLVKLARVRERVSPPMPVSC
jgi:hypothetical protein